MTTNKRVLEFQADRIEAVLARHKIGACVTGGNVSPRWIQFQIMPTLGTKVNRITSLADELAMALRANSCRVARQSSDGLVTVEIPRADPQVIHLLKLQRRLQEQKQLPAVAAVLGLADDGAPLLVRLPSPQVAHLLIAGTTGSGKSALAQTIIASLALTHSPDQLQFVLIDPKRSGFGPLAGLPHLMQPVITDPGEAAAVLGQLAKLMEQRDKGAEPRIVIAIDELVDLLITQPGAETPLMRLAQRGREPGLHLVACTQKPAAAVIGSLTKANFPVRLVGHVTSPEDAKVATGYGGTGAEHLQGPGDFIAVNGGQITRFQAAYTPTTDLARIVRDLTQQHHTPVVIDLPLLDAPTTDDDQLAAYVARARTIWPTLQENGGLRWGAKADLAEAIFGERDTAGHRGKWVDRVIADLEADPEPIEGQSEPVEGQKKTTTTARRLLLRNKRGGPALETVVVVFKGGK